ncbi:helix-turn-helix domain-containing protein [Methylobacterium sp. Leaf85]|uniref:helix-turn-helix domain-containing protein n=1 Tax=Methylobacterium sp. Leaf85 TaxID=1736241 RepID=UPI0009E75098|nr:helix-turn-helix transcriptional regulator [Methylobacterium sp. Leaf85]
MSTKKATDLDAEVGARIAFLRKTMGKSQTELGQAVGVTFQQIQKYEKGQNRIGAGRLGEIARFLETTVASLCGEEAVGGEDSILPLMGLTGAPQLLQAYGSVNPKVRSAMLAAIRAIAAAAVVAEASAKPEEPVRGPGFVTRKIGEITYR